MAASESAVSRLNDQDDCPLCLDPLPPTWDADSPCQMFTCCGKMACKSCIDKKTDFLMEAFGSGSWGDGESQLLTCCPCCRTVMPIEDVGRTRMMQKKFEKGHLPLRLYMSLGRSYVTGEGCARDLGKGLKILKLGAEKGDPLCQAVLGDAYSTGAHGLPKSRKDAKRWLLAAAQQGDAFAEYNLAIMMKNEGSESEYLRYLRGSVSKGYGPACTLLGAIHFSGMHGFQESAEEAIHVLTPAAESGHAQAMRVLGMVCTINWADDEEDPTANPTFTQGVHWLRRAAEKRDEEAIEILAELKEGIFNKCFRCRKEAPPETAYLRCSRCRAAWYCSKECQVLHWKEERGHKQRCIKWE